MSNELPEATGPRRASWIEAFYDLVYVLAIARLTHLLAHQPTALGLAFFGGLFMVVFWGWAGYTSYSSRYDHEDFFQRVVVMIQMLAGIGVALSIEQVEHGGVTFVLSYVVIRLCLLTLYERVRRENPTHAARIRLLQGGFGVAVLLWLASLLVPTPWRFAVWALASLTEIGTPWLLVRSVAVVPPAPDHMPERFGLFTLIVLGETIGAVALGLQDAPWSAATLVGSAGGFAAAAAVWWNYFNFVEHAPLQCSLGSGLGYAYLHVPLLLGLTLAAVGVGLVLDGQAPAFALLLLGGGAGLWVLGFMYLQRLTYPVPEARLITPPALLAAAGVVLCALAGHWVPDWVTLAGVALVLAAQAAHDVRRRGAIPRRAFQPSSGPQATGVKVYQGEGVAVSFDAARCVHAGECLRGLPAVFDARRRPWIDLRHGAPEQVVEVVRRCPSGALKVVSGEPEAPVEAHAAGLALVAGGPLRVAAGTSVVGEDGAALEGPLMLCRCGKSAGYPLCDGSHLKDA